MVETCRDLDKGWIRVTSRIALLVVIAYAAYVQFCIMRDSDSFQRLYMDFGIVLPQVTIFFLGPVAKIILPALAVVAIAKEFLPWPRLTLLTNMIVLGLVMLVHALFHRAMFDPLHDIITRVSGG